MCKRTCCRGDETRVGGALDPSNFRRRFPVPASAASLARRLPQHRGARDNRAEIALPPNYPTSGKAGAGGAWNGQKDGSRLHLRSGIEWDRISIGKKRLWLMSKANGRRPASPRRAARCGEGKDTVDGRIDRYRCVSVRSGKIKRPGINYWRVPGVYGRSFVSELFRLVYLPRRNTRPVFIAALFHHPYDFIIDIQNGIPCQ